MKQFVLLLLGASALCLTGTLSHAQSLAETGQVAAVEGTMAGNATAASNSAVNPAPNVANNPLAGIMPQPAGPIGGSVGSALGGLVDSAQNMIPGLSQQTTTPMAPFVRAENAPMESLFFTRNEIASIMRANQGFIAPTEAFDEKNQGENPNDRGPRTITLSGIVYNGPRDWTVWINGERVTPRNIPSRIMSISVNAQKVALKWMDIGNQRIVNLTLSPHQRYNLDQDTITPASWQ